MLTFANISASLKRVVSYPNISSAIQQNVNSLLPVTSLIPNLHQQRYKSKNLRIKRKRRHTVEPFWHAKVTRTLYPENVTPENEKFIEEVVVNEYKEKEESMLEMTPFVKGEWNSKSHRVGLIGKKIGVYPMWLKTGKRILTTLIHISDNHVIKHVPYSQLAENDYTFKSRRSKNPKGAIIVGADSADPRKFTKEYYNMFEQAGVRPKKKLTKFLVSDNAVLPPGTQLFANHFRPGDSVDISSYSIDRGFHGVMKRWGFKGGPAAHGCTKSHRRPGYIGFGGRRGVLIGKKMPGHMGMEFVTMRGLKIVRVNSEFQCIWVMGTSVPGDTGTYLNMYDSGLHHNRYRNPEDHPPFPTFDPLEHQIEEVDWHWEKLQSFSDDSITFEEAESK